MADDLVLDALKLAIRSDEDTLLVKAGKTEGLFKSRAAGPKKAMAACLDADPPLLEITREEKTSAKSKTVKQYAKITEAGIATLIDQTPPAEYPELLSTVAPSYREAVLLGCLRGAARLDAEIDRAIEAARTLHEAILNQARAMRESLDQRLDLLRSQREAITQAIEQIGQPPEPRAQPEPTPEAVAPSAPDSAPVAPPSAGADAASSGKLLRRYLPPEQSETAIDFQRDLARELALRWREAGPGSRLDIEDALYNVGVETIGQVGDIVPFDGNLHDTDEDVAVGQDVEIVEPGWQLVNPRGVLTISRPRVRLPIDTPCPTTSEVDRVGDAQH